MRYGRALLAGLGWAGTLGGLALCVLIFLSAYMAFDRDRPGVGPREDGIVRLPAVPEAEVPRVPLADPPGRLAEGEDRGRSGSGGGADGRTARGHGTPRTGTTPGTGTPGGAPLAPGTVTPPAGGGDAPGRPGPAPSSGTGAGGGGGAAPPQRQTVGDTTSDVVRIVGDEVKRVSPPVGEAVNRTGERVGEAVDALTSPVLPRG